MLFYPKDKWNVSKVSIHLHLQNLSISCIASSIYYHNYKSCIEKKKKLPQNYNVRNFRSLLCCLYILFFLQKLKAAYMGISRITKQLIREFPFDLIPQNNPINNSLSWVYVIGWSHPVRFYRWDDGFHTIILTCTHVTSSQQRRLQETMSAANERFPQNILYV